MSIWKELLGQLTRKFLVFLFGVLVSHAIINQDFAARLTESATGYMVTALLIILPLVWGVAKARYNKWFAAYALNATPDTSLSQVKREVLDNVKGVSSV